MHRWFDLHSIANREEHFLGNSILMAHRIMTWVLDVIFLVNILRVCIGMRFSASKVLSESETICNWLIPIFQHLLQIWRPIWTNWCIALFFNIYLYIAQYFKLSHVYIKSFYKFLGDIVIQNFSVILKEIQMITITYDTYIINFCIISIDDSCKFVPSELFTCSVTSATMTNWIKH